MNYFYAKRLRKISRLCTVISLKISVRSLLNALRKKNSAYSSLLMLHLVVLTSQVSTLSSRLSLPRMQKPIFIDQAVLLVPVVQVHALLSTHSDRRDLSLSSNTKLELSSKRLVYPSPMMSLKLPSEIP